MCVQDGLQSNRESWLKGPIEEDSGWTPDYNGVGSGCLGLPGSSRISERGKFCTVLHRIGEEGGILGASWGCD